MKKAILYMALALPLGMNLNACDKDSEETKEPRFCRNYKDLVKVNVFYNGSCNGRKTQSTQTYPALITIPEVEEPKTPTQVVKKPSIHCNLSVLKEISETPTLKLGLSQLEPINVCCEDQYAQVFTRAKAQKLAIDQAAQAFSDHAYKQKTHLNTLIVAVNLLLSKDSSQERFKSLRQGISEAMFFYTSAYEKSESYFQEIREPLNVILDIDTLDKCKSKKLKKVRQQIELYNASLHCVEHRLRAVKSRDAQTIRENARLRQAILIAEATEEEKKTESCTSIETPVKFAKKRRAKAAEAQMNLK